LGLLFAIQAFKFAAFIKRLDNLLQFVRRQQTIACCIFLAWRKRCVLDVLNALGFQVIPSLPAFWPSRQQRSTQLVHLIQRRQHNHLVEHILKGNLPLISAALGA
jgi:hypothetical protein